MSLTKQKVDVMARILLSKDPGEWRAAREELERLMNCPDEVQAENTIRQIHKLLAEIGVPTSTVGHNYLVDAISTVVSDPNAMTGISKPGGLLEQVGQRHGRKSDAVARAIRISIEHAWTHGNREFQDEHFKVRSSITLAPTMVGFISRAANIVRLQTGPQ